ncbi:MAG: ImmA/IrrE family metallo-endopeptidase [Merismopedia sp. SIO2A8]|nr:ImmA/IrrE family metallo-endopeptidase [Symploca sp. SIO2B6]NET47372.1 ImmA/IrrE family metallo-endopeptidase [Merismopedia sp. SIO2A8]
MAYQHPGQTFIEQYGPLLDKRQAHRYVTQYADFLRQASGMGETPPILLDHIYRSFEIPTPYRAPLIDQQGILVDADAGIILIKDDDPRARQRFTEGHELMELLFDAHNERAAQATNTSQKTAIPIWQGPLKEQWCDRGSAALLMPQSSFVPQLMELDVSLETARILSKTYCTSFMATLLQMMEHSAGSHATVVWRWAISRKDQQESDRTGIPPKAKLRVWWRKCSKRWDGGFIPKNKSISRPSSIIDTAFEQRSHQCTETLLFEKTPIQCRIETMSLPLADQSCVLSLLHTE